jgi:pimeloyl-ACP methyl ester carboxylesterase
MRSDENLKRSSAAVVLLAAFLLIPQAFGKGPAGTAPETAKVPVNGLEIGYRIYGRGEPLLMIMGYAGEMDVWPPELVQELSRSYRVILFDNRGMGYSSGADAPVSIELMASDAAELLTALHIESAHVLGWSMGAMVAEQLAISYPQRVRKLVLYGASLDNEPVMAAIKRMGAAGAKQLLPMMFPAAWLKANPDIFGRLPSPSIRPIPAVVSKQREAIARWAPDPKKLAGISEEVLLVSGVQDNVVPPAQALRLAEIIPGSWLARFRDAGHWLMYQAPQDLASLVHAFLSIREDLLVDPAGAR